MGSNPIEASEFARAFFASALAASYSNCEGHSHLYCALKHYHTPTPHPHPRAQVSTRTLDKKIPQTIFIFLESICLEN